MTEMQVESIGSIISKERIDLDKALKIIGVDHYDPFLIINKTKGKMEGDKYWMRIKKYRAFYSNEIIERVITIIFE